MEEAKIEFSGKFMLCFYRLLLSILFILISTVIINCSKRKYVIPVVQYSDNKNIPTHVQIVDGLKNYDYLTFSPDGKFLITANNETNAVLIRDTKTGNALREIHVSQIEPFDSSDLNLNKVNSISFTSDGLHILIGHGKNQLSFFNIQTGKQVKKIIYKCDFYSENYSFSKNLLAKSNYKSLCILNILTGKIIFKKNLSARINCLSLSPDAENLLIGLESDNFKILKIKTGEFCSIKLGYNVAALSYSPCGKFFVYGCDDKISIIDVYSGKLVSTFQQGGKIKKIIYSMDGKYILCLNNFCTLKVWDINSEKMVFTYNSKDIIGYLAYHPDNYTFAFDLFGDGICIINFQNGSIRTYKSKRSYKYYPNINFNGRYIALNTNENESALIFDLVKGKNITGKLTRNLPFKKIVFAPRGNIIAGLMKSSIMIINVVSGKILNKYQFGSQINIKSCHFFNNDIIIIQNKNDNPDQNLNELVFYNWKKHTIIKTFNLKKDINLVFSNQNILNIFSTYSASTPCASGYGINYYHAMNGRLINSIKDINGFSSSIQCLNISPDNKYLSYIYEGVNRATVIYAWDYKKKKLDYQLIQLIEISNAYISHYQYTNNGKYVIISTEAGKILIYNYISKILIRTLYSHPTNIKSFLITKDDRHIFSIDNDSLIKIGKIASGENISLRLYDNGSWLANDSTGNFDCSPDILKKIYFVKGLEIIQSEKLLKKYHKPGMIKNFLNRQ